MNNSRYGTGTRRSNMALIGTLSAVAALGLPVAAGQAAAAGDDGAVYTMTNATGVPLTFDLVAQDVVVSAGKRSFVAAGDSPHSIAATAVFVPRSVTIPAGQARSVKLTVTVGGGA